MAPETYPEFSNHVAQPILLELRSVGFHNASASVLVTECLLPRPFEIALLLIHINVEPVLNLIVKFHFWISTRLADSKTFELNNSQLVYRIWSEIYRPILLLSGIDIHMDLARFVKFSAEGGAFVVPVGKQPSVSQVLLTKDGEIV